jgi:ElaB/YqjD/DUF883 family membrane-anchored ribosome-binding protein
MKTSRIDPDSIDLDFLKQEFNRFRAEIAGVKDKFSGNAAEALDQMGAYLNGGHLSSRISSLEQELEHLGAKLKGTSKEAVTKLEKEVGNRPIASIAIAFGVGLLASQLFRRS